MAPQVTGLSSMATRSLLTELAATWSGSAGMQSAGGVEVARRVRAGEVVDVVVLADGPMRMLEMDGFLVGGSLVSIAVSGVAVAVRENEGVPSLSTPAAVKTAVLAAGRIGYSTGPSGDHLLGLLDDWDIRGSLGDRLVQAPPGVPVGRLLVEGTVDLAVQQNSELIGIPGIVVAGELPGQAACDTVFTAGVTSVSPHVQLAADFIAFLAATGTAEAKKRHGMRPP